MIKKIVWLGVLAGLGYSLCKLFRQLAQYASLSQSLPLYLKDMTGFKPKYDFQFRANYLKIEIGYPESVIAQQKELEKVIKDYISDYYDSLSKYPVELKIYPTS